MDDYTLFLKNNGYTFNKHDLTIEEIYNGFYFDKNSPKKEKIKIGFIKSKYNTYIKQYVLDNKLGVGRIIKFAYDPYGCYYVIDFGEFEGIHYISCDKEMMLMSKEDWKQIDNAIISSSGIVTVYPRYKSDEYVLKVIEKNNWNLDGYSEVKYILFRGYIILERKIVNKTIIVKKPKEITTEQQNILTLILK